MTSHGDSHPQVITFTFRERNSLYHTKAIKKLLFYNSTSFFTGSCDSTIKLWSTSPTSIYQQSSLEYHSNWITDLDIDQENHLLFSSSNDQSISIWDTNSLSFSPSPYPVKTFPNIHNDYITSIKYNKITNTLYSSSLDGRILYMKLDTDYRTDKIIDNLSSIYSIDLAEESNLVIASVYSNELALFDIRAKGRVASLNGHSGIIRKVRISPDGNDAISISSDKMIKIWDLTKQKVIKTLDYHQSSITSLYVNKTFTKVITGSIDGDMYIMDMQTHSYAKFDELNGRVNDITMNDDETRILACDEDGIRQYTIGKVNDESDSKSERKIDFDRESKSKCEYGKTLTIVKDEIVEYKLMNNKIYVIVKYKNGMGAVFNIATMKKVPGSNAHTYDKLVNILKEIDRDTLSSWCNVDIKLGTLSIELRENRCFVNDINKYNKNLLEEIIKRNFMINENSKFRLDTNGNGAITDSTISTNKIRKKNESEKSFKSIDNKNDFTCGQYVFSTVLKSFLSNRIGIICKKCFYSLNNKETLFKDMPPEINSNKDIDNLFVVFDLITQLKSEKYCFYIRENVDDINSICVFNYQFPSFAFNNINENLTYNYNAICSKYRQTNHTKKIDIDVDFKDFKDIGLEAFFQNFKEKYDFVSSINIAVSTKLISLKKNLLRFIDSSTIVETILKDKAFLSLNKKTQNKIQEILKKSYNEIILHSIGVVDANNNIINSNDEYLIIDLLNVIYRNQRENILRFVKVPFSEILKQITLE